MVSRRATLALLGGFLGGCLGFRDTQSAPTETPARTPTRVGDDPDATADSTSTTGPDPPPDTNAPPDDWPPAEWKPDWTHGMSVSHVVGLDALEGRLLVTANDDRGPTVIQSYDPGSRSVQWSHELPGEAVENSMLQRSQVLRNWGVTDAGDSLLAVTGQTYSRQWTELHALEPATGDERWSLRLDRTLAVRGVVDGTLYVLAREFEQRSTAEYHGTDTPTPEPRSAALLALDRTDGSVRWEREFTGVGAVAADDSGVYVTERSLLRCLDHDGNQRWAVQGNARGHDIYPGPAVIYHVDKPEWDRMVVRGVGRDGTVRWTRRFAADESVRHGDRLYVAGDRLTAVRPDGTLAWHSPGHAGRLTFGPSGKRVYVRADWQADAVDAVALGDGTRQWTFDPPISNAWPESATDESVVAGGIGEFSDGVGQPLYRVDAADGEATARYLDQDPITTRPLGEYVFAGTGNYETGGQVLALPL